MPSFASPPPIANPVVARSVSISNTPWTNYPAVGSSSVATVFQSYRTIAASRSAALSGTGPGGQASPPVVVNPPASETVVGGNLDGQAFEMIALINQARTQAGLKPLVVNSALMRLAGERASALANGPFTSDLAQYGWPAQMEQAAGIQALGLGAENVAEASSVAQAFALLMASPPHRANMLDRYDTQIGVGIAPWGAGVAISELFIGPSQ